MRIVLNGEVKDVPGECGLDKLLAHFSLPPQRIAIELNKEVIPRRDWNTVAIKEDDHIEVVHFVGGG